MKNPRYTNEIGGILIDHDDDMGSIYTDPGESLHAVIESGAFGPVAPYVPPPEPEITLDEARALQIAQINRDFEVAARALTAGYPEAERLTWPTQQTETLAWAASDAPTPYLDGLADARGITHEEMRTLTLDQVRAFQAASQWLVGTRQRLRDQINVAGTIEDVQAVGWPPGTEPNIEPPAA